jgi:DNA-binding LacI/PurR family transcriptional regulator
MGYAARRAGGVRSTNVGFLVFGREDSQTAPAFQSLLRGISGSCTEQNLNLIFSIVQTPSELPPKIEQGRIDGVLLHGERPSPAIDAKLRALPTVWLMANRERPVWGDQVLPDNTAIGEIAAQYLLRRGHRRVAYLSAATRAWSLELRSFSFAQTARDAGAEVHQINVTTIDELAPRLLEIDPLPSGLFVAEDRLLHVLESTLIKRGMRVGPQRDLEIVSCNNERPYLIGLENMPATIDIRAESIGRRGVEQLLWRIANPNVPERVRCMVEPILVEPQPS